MFRKASHGLLCLFVLALFAAWGTIDSKIACAQTIKIGVAGPMKATPGKNMWRGAILARDAINKDGGILVAGAKRPVELLKIDTNESSSIVDAVSAVERAIGKVDFLVGNSRTEATLAIQDIAMAHKKILLSCGAAHPELCARVGANYDKYKYYFRLVINSAYMGKVLLLHLGDVADTVRKELGIEKPKLAVIADKLKYADPIVKAIETRAPAMNIEVVGVWRPSANASDVTAELAAIRESGAHIIFQVNAGPMGVALGKQWGELQIPAALVGASVYGIVKGYWAGTGGNGHYVTTQTGIARVELSERTVPFYDSFEKKFDAFPGYESVTYDAIYVLKNAIERADTLNPDVLVSELEKTDYMGAFGRISFYPKGHKWAHDLKFGPEYNTWVIVQWRDPGKQVCVWPNGWEGVNYEGGEDYVLPPWMVEYWEKKK